MSHKILLVDDERDIVEFLQYTLKQEGFEVISAYDGIEALSLMNENPDLIILDVMMPRMNGFEFCRNIQENQAYNQIPIIFLTAKSSEADEIAGLNLGASDYIKKPVSTKALVARVKSNLRKNIPASPEFPMEITAGPLYINKDQYTVQIDGVEKIFPRKEFEILFYLANNPGRVFSRESLLKEIWGSGVFVVDRTVDVHIRKIREKLDNHAELIETIKGVGYRFKSAE
jgi:two-component system, OmpR family, alkaline phosphatase synthesis response regulator PhoP